ncbi:MFS transporter [Psychrobacillus glaciei]|uniref:MFS transporter n=1 Tax=Psychrobacillus glaciei TaxID=2283160 RepID=A0A5J6STX1_9BACI|nr:MFS transporter [Psychrobacillus glaciei]QFG00395.1 MFS transporter [Psychrobacillus glaciei]
MSSIWKNKDFTLLISGQTVSTFGSGISSFAIPWLILEITGSALQMGFVIAAGLIPYLLLSLPAGVWADRYNRKHLMMLSNLGKLLLLLLIPLSTLFLKGISIELIYFVRIGMSFCDAIFDSSYGASLPNIVNKNQLKQANSAMQTGIAASTIIGPAIAGILLIKLGASLLLLIDCATYLLSIISLMMIKKDFSPKKSQKKNLMSKDIAEGILYVWKQPTVRTLTILAFFSNISNAAISIVLLYRLKVELNISPELIGIVLSGISVGALSASLLSTALGKKFNMKKIMYFSLFVQIIPPFLIILTKNPFVMASATVLMGSAGVLWNIYAESLRQSIIPNEMLGRAGASIKMVSSASIPMGSSAGGALGELFGTLVVFVLSGSIRFFNLLLAVKMNIEDIENAETPNKVNIEKDFKATPTLEGRSNNLK